MHGPQRRTPYKATVSRYRPPPPTSALPPSAVHCRATSAADLEFSLRVPEVSGLRAAQPGQERRFHLRDLHERAAPGAEFLAEPLEQLVPGTRQPVGIENLASPGPKPIAGRQQAKTSFLLLRHGWDRQKLPCPRDQDPAV